MEQGQSMQITLGNIFIEHKRRVFTVRIIKLWNNVPRVVVDSPALDMFKIQLDKVLIHLV